MLISQLKESLPFLMKARITTMLVGHHGVGKSEGVKQFANEIGFKYFDLRAGTQDTGDLIGLADFVVDERGIKIATKFMTPDWLKDLVDHCEQNPDKGAIVFIDEINRARPDVLQALFQLVLDYKMHTVTLPKNCYVIAAMNPDTEDYNVTNMDDKALLDRFCHIKVSPSTGEWLDYAKKAKFSPEVINFIQESPESLKDVELIPIDFKDVVKPSPRSWAAVHRLVEAKTPKNLLRELIFGLVGSSLGIAFMESLENSEKPISGEMIATEFSKHSDKIKKFSKSTKGNRIDLIKNSCDSLLEYAKTKQENKETFTKEEEANIQDFLITIPVDIAFDLCKKMYYEPINRNLIETSTKLKDILTKSREKAGMGINK